jgi:uncharacterized NAD(P)/FAD-binding protein YdhS
MNNPSNFDFTLIGAGIAGAAAILSLLENMENTESTAECWKIAVFDKDPELWKGLPYGYRSSSNSLTITTLKEFIPPSERDDFLNWLISNKHHWLKQYATQGGVTAKAWIERNNLNLERDNWEEIFIPRRLFGDFLRDKVAKKIENAEKAGKVSFSYFTAEVKAIDKKDGIFMVGYEDLSQLKQIRTQKIILSIGSTPMKSITNLQGDSKFIYVNDTYFPSLDKNLQTIENRLQNNFDAFQKNHLLILGTNASSIELLYLINGKPELKKCIDQVVVISQSGILPNRISTDNTESYSFEGLESLKKVKHFSSEILYSTIEQDLKIAYLKGVKLGDLYYQINDLIVELLEMLPDKGKQHFYCEYGLQYSKLIRRSGIDYSDGLDQLRNEKKLTQLKGKYLQLKKDINNPEQVVLEYEDQGGSVSDYKDSFAIVVNCGGFENLDQTSSPLLKYLVDNGICTINCTNRGVVVNENLEACDGFYVIGPLLGGIFNNKARLWHVENAKSIFSMAKLLSGQFAHDLSKMTTLAVN